VATPIDASILGGLAITQLDAGFYHSLLLAEDGHVFSFGRNQSGRTGQGTDSGLTLVATPIDASNLGGHDVVQVDAGGDINLMIVQVPEPSSLAIGGLALFGMLRCVRHARSS
jgi:alpha-tubulin suppressor-like RCC1 family protein